MVLAAVADAVIGVAICEAWKGVKPIFNCKELAKKLEKTASLVKPYIDRMLERASDPNLSDSSAPGYQRLKEFQGVLQSAIDRARKAQQTKMFALPEKFNAAKEICKFLEEIDEFVHTEVPLNIALDLQQLREEFRQLREEVRNIRRKLVQTELLTLQNSSPTQTNIDGIHGAQAAERSNSFNSQVPVCQRKHWVCISVSMRSNKFSTRGM